jgi:O-6-methylguanine DNA methyltransferase
MIYRLVETDWGFFGIVLAETGKVVATFLPQRQKLARQMVASRYPSATESANGAEALCRQVSDYFRGKQVSWNVEIAWSDVSEFRRRVLEACRLIPFGSTASYADLARAAGSPGAARAVGSTMANNQLPLIIPCHRVLHSDGSLGGFSSPQGLSQKVRMLQLENPNFEIVTQARTISRTRVHPTRKVARLASLVL